MKIFLNFTKITTLIFINIIGVFNVLSQDTTNVESSYFEYTNPAREVAYLHLNKSTYFQKEYIGYTAYVVDKKNKLPSLLTTNLYISVLDESENVIYNQLVRVFDGVASNVIELDSKFKSGVYTIRAYTNWMFNFEELNYFEEKFKVIDPAQESDNIFNYTSQDVKVDFTPESGLILDGVLNNIGIVVKDENNYGIPFAKGTLIDESNNVLTQFETNQYGIGKFPMLADKSKQYTVQIVVSNNTYSYKVNNLTKPEGVIIQTKRQEENLVISVLTNPTTLENIKGKRYHLFLHNGDIFQSIPVDFNNLTEVNFLVNYKDCAPGTNVITLFDEQQNMVAERLFFNYHDIKIANSQSITSSKKGDSTIVNLKYNSLNKNQIQNLSVSVLPAESKSYNRHHNLFTYVYLQPYLKSYIENAIYYFVDIDNQKKFELDNLLLTQGKSSFNWKQILNYDNDFDFKFTFEQGVRLRANVNKGAVTTRETYAISTSIDEDPLFFDLEKGENSFYVDNFFPQGDNTIIASKVGKQGLEPAKLYFQSFPSKIPDLIKPTFALAPKYNNKTIPQQLNDYVDFEFDKENTVILNEIIINTPRELDRQKKLELTNGSYGYVSIVSDTDRMMFNTLAQYLLSKNLNVDQSGGSFRVFNAPPSMNSSGGDPRGQSRPGDDGNGLESQNSQPLRYSGGIGGAMTIFLNDVQLYDATFLNTLTLFDIDYIDIDRRGFNMGLRGGNGVIRIYTKQGVKRVKRNLNTSQEFEIPLVFNKKINYKVPQFSNINSSFYNSFGTVAWQPNLQTDKAGNLTFKIDNFDRPVTIVIEGITEDGQYIIEHKKLRFNN